MYFRFYRHVLEPSLQFNEHGQLASGPNAIFKDIPETPLLTMNLDIPQAWMVEAVKSPYDLDNIYLKEVRISFKITLKFSPTQLCLVMELNYGKEFLSRFTQSWTRVPLQIFMHIGRNKLKDNFITITKYNFLIESDRLDATIII